MGVAARSWSCCCILWLLIVLLAASGCAKVGLSSLPEDLLLMKDCVAELLEKELIGHDLADAVSKNRVLA